MTEMVDFVTEDQHHNSLTLFEPERIEPDTPLILVAPAMGVKAAYYRPLAEAFASKGCLAATMDLRGQGLSGFRASRKRDYGYLEMIQYDWPAAIRALRQQYPVNPLFLLGHSLGGQLSALYLASHRQELSGLILVASASVYHKYYDRPFKLLIQTQVAWGLAELLGYFPGHRVGFAGREARLEIRDWARIARTGRFDLRRRRHRTKGDAQLGQVQLPVLAVSFADDALAPEAAVRGLCAKLGKAALTHWHFEPATLGATQLGHFRWAKAPQPLVERLCRWLDEHGAVPVNDRSAAAVASPNRLDVG